MYTRGRQAVASSVPVPDFLSELEGVGYGPGFKRGLRELLDTPRPAESVVVNLAPDLVYSLFQVVRAVVAERVLIVAHNRTEGLRNAEEQALLRAVAAPRFTVVRLDRSWRGTPFTLVELRGDGAPRDERAVYLEATSI
jgi:hypothetical protein